MELRLHDRPVALKHADEGAARAPAEPGEAGWIARLDWTLPWMLAMTGILITIVLST